jgi:hypothetical protein
LLEDGKVVYKNNSVKQIMQSQLGTPDYSDLLDKYICYRNQIQCTVCGVMALEQTHHGMDVIGEMYVL